MDPISFFIDVILHLDDHLASIIQQFGIWTYSILFTIIFLETGLVVTPYLPGDSLLFATGTFTALGYFNLPIIFIILTIAAILGDSLNYAIGHYIGPKVFKKKYKWLDRRALDKTKEYFDKYGSKTIVLARFIPIVRTFAPFLAGVGAMEYRKFLAYNIVGGILWVSAFLFSGYYFGNIPWVKDNFSKVVIAIIFLSLVPVAIEAYKYYKAIKEQNNGNTAKKQSSTIKKRK